MQNAKTAGWSWCRGVMCLSTLLALVLAQGTLSSQTTQPYPIVDNVEDAWVNLNLPAVRPMLLWGKNSLYAVNTHDSTVSLFNPSTVQPVGTVRVPWGPVSIARWVRPADGKQLLLVVCSGSYVLAFVDRFTGDIVDMLTLPPEPRDILVDPTTNQAFISCAAQDLVVEIDLNTVSQSRSWTIPSKNPLSLAFDGGGDILVAPLLSGNNSAIHRRAVETDFRAGALGILDLDVVASSGLPDTDCFRIRRSANVVEPAVSHSMTIVHAQAVHPVTGQLWQVGLESNNKDPMRQTEPSINGDAVDNVLRIIDLPAAGGPASVPVMSIDLDLASGLGQPIGVSFTSTGTAYVVGLLTDNVGVFGQDGSYVKTISLPSGSIPRSALYSQARDELFVYAWGSNEIHVIQNDSVQRSLDLGFDPTPQIVKDGRAIYYSAAHSRDNNASCNSCHIEARSDNLAWNLSDDEKDEKGPMVTQSLTGIDRLVPLHWRGERELIDFNGAFKGLLGASQSLGTEEGGEFDKLEAFILSLRNPANPNQDRDRILNDTIHAPGYDPTIGGTASEGLARWMDSNFVVRCDGCHMLPLGTANSVVKANDPTAPEPRQGFFDVPSMQEMFRRQMDADPTDSDVDTITVTFNPGQGLPQTAEYPVTGFGFTHAGIKTDLAHFTAFLEDSNVFSNPATPSETSSLRDFIWQWDSGLAPTVHESYLMNQSTVAAVTADVSRLVAQANLRNCGLAVFGSMSLGASERPLAWYYDRGLGTFVCEDTTVPNQTLGIFLAEAAAGTGKNVFVGTPVGMAERFAVDYDLDGIFNFEESANMVYVPDTDSTDTIMPVITDIVTQWFTTRVATVIVSTDEPTQVTLTYGTAGQPDATAISSEFKKVHRLVLTDLLPSTNGGVQFTYTGTATATDRAGNMSLAVSLPDGPQPPLFQSTGPITTEEFARGVGADEQVVEVLSWNAPIVISGGSFQGTAHIKLRDRQNGPPFNPAPLRRVVFRVLRNGSTQGLTFSSSINSFSINGVPYNTDPDALTGPFLFSGRTDSNGEVDVTLSASGFSSGDTLTLNVEGWGPVTAGDTPSSPNLFSFEAWVMPDTDSAKRSLEVNF